MALNCGACNLCCKVLQVPDIKKPSNMLCWHTGIHGGCKVHHLKDTDETLMACKQFKCLWLASQATETPMPRYMRPDQLHVMFGPQDREDDTLCYVHVDPDYSSAWQSQTALGFMQEKIQVGLKFEIFVGEERFELKD